MRQALHKRFAEIWLWNYLTAPSAPKVDGPVHIMFMTVDHWEPKIYKPTPEVEQMRIDRWRTEYPLLADAHRDAFGRTPQHTFSYPSDEFDGPTMAVLADLAFRGYGEVELQLHHVDDTEDSVRAKFEQALDTFPQYGALITLEPEPQKTFGLVHGNWSLDDGRPGWCGVTTELDLLRDLNCYADFTFPAAHQPSQPSQLNDIFYAVDTPERKSYDTGVSARVGQAPPERGFMIFQGALGMDFRNHKRYFLPRIENSGTFYRSNPPTEARADFWVRQHIHVKDRPEWVFIKTHCHGVEEGQLFNWFEGPFDALFTYLETRYNDGEQYILHYVTTREAYNIAKAAEAGKTGNPDDYRDYLIPPYANSAILSSARYKLDSGGEVLAMHFLDDGLITTQFRQRQISRIAGAIRSVQLNPQGGQVTLQDVHTDPITYESALPIQAVTGATLLESTPNGSEFSIRLEPLPGATIVTWSYAPAAAVAEPDA